MSRALVTSSKYSPGNLTSHSLEQLFVGRERLLGDVVQRISLSATTAHKHRILMVGPRGIGKTHFIALVMQRLRTATELDKVRNRLVVARLNEEGWGISSYLDLLLRIVASSDVTEVKNDLAQQRIHAAHKRGVANAITVAESAICELVGDKTLLLVCENLGGLLSAIGTTGQQRWRSFMQERTFWSILATTTHLVPSLQHHTAPFYGFFTVRAMEPFDLETAILLLQRKALIDNKPELARRLGSPVGRARVRAIHHLAGGNPRVYIALAEFITEQTLDDLVGPFMGMADDLTPYYQGKMQQLSPQQRKLVERMAKLARPRPVKLIAEQCLMSQQTAAKQIGLLVKKGLVRRQRLGRETFCELSEPLMRICFDIKGNRTRHLRLFVDLLRHWFSETELRDQLGRMETEDHPRTLKANITLGGTDIEYLEAQALVEARGLLAGVEKFMPIIRRLASVTHAGYALGRLFAIEVEVRGPISLARQIRPAMKAMSGLKTNEIVSGSLVWLHKTMTFEGRLLGPEWAQATRILAQELDGIEACQLALELLTVAVDYANSQDPAVLMQLPIERRTLFESIGDERPPEFDPS